MTAKRKTRFASFKGTKREAEAKLTNLMVSARTGDYVDPSKITLSEFLDKWLIDWGRTNLSPSTFEQYGLFLTLNVRPRIGAMKPQKLKAAHLTSLYSELLQRGRKRQGAEGDDPIGLSARTVGYAHRILYRALGHACQWGLLGVNPVLSVDPPRTPRTEISILREEQVRDVLQKLRGQPIYPLAVLGLGTGMRRGELLALRWKDVDLDAGKIQVERSMEQTKERLRSKEPKTRHGRRQISIPASIAAELRAHRHKQAEVRLAPGLGKDPDDALVFRHVDGAPIIPNSASTEWRRVVRILKRGAIPMPAD